VSRSIRAGVALAALLFSAGAQAEQHAMPAHVMREPARAGPMLTVQEALALASGDQPAVEALQREAIASDQESLAARFLPDPQLTAGIQNFPITGSNAFSANDFMTMLTVGLMREQVRRSKREAQSAQVAAEALVSRRKAGAEERRIRRDVMLAWIDAVDATAKERLIERIIQDLHAGHHVMEAGVQTGEATPALALQMDSEIALEESLLADTRRAEEHARAELARWIGSAADRPLPDAVPDIEVPADDPGEVLALTAHPSVQAALAEQEAADRQVEVAREDRKPDITWSVMLGLRAHFGQMATGTLSIPLQTNRRGRQDRLIAAAQARADAASLRIEDERRDLEEQYRTARADYDGADAQLIHIDREAIPALEAAFKTAEARYASGGDNGHAALDTAFDIVRRYAETMVKSTETRADRARAAAKIIYVVGDTGQ
jgi:outer membrane protein, heavy metal efflux system